MYTLHSENALVPFAVDCDPLFAIDSLRNEIVKYHDCFVAKNPALDNAAISQVNNHLRSLQLSAVVSDKQPAKLTQFVLSTQI